MTEREMLIELIVTAENEVFRAFPYTNSTKRIEMVADYLLSSGVIIPPVKVGDTIYEIHERRKGNEWVKIISERVVHGVEIGINGSMTARCGTTISVFLSYIGKTVFLTREEAENALKECDENA